MISWAGKKKTNPNFAEVLILSLKLTHLVDLVGVGLSGKFWKSLIRLNQKYISIISSVTSKISLRREVRRYVIIKFCNYFLEFWTPPPLLLLNLHAMLSCVGHSARAKKFPLISYRDFWTPPPLLSILYMDLKCNTRL